jgi:hypothetical protein
MKVVWFRFMVSNATFNNISVIWRSVLLVEETGENHRPVLSTLRHERGLNSQL